MKCSALLSLLLVVLLSGCSASFVAASVGLVGTASVAAYDCDAHVVVAVRDRLGNAYCGVPLVATRWEAASAAASREALHQAAPPPLREVERRELSSCRWSTLSAGTWQLRERGASVAGARSDASGMFSIEPASGCARETYTLELDRNVAPAGVVPR